MKPSILSCAQACEKACNHYVTHSGVPSRTPFRCPLGFTVWQVVLMKHLATLPTAIFTYDDVANGMKSLFGLSVSRDAVRGTMDRLRKRGHLKYVRKREGTLQGVLLHNTGLNCMAITREMMQVNPAVYSTVHSMTHTPLSKEDRQSNSNLSASEQLLALDDETIRQEFPNLASAGFGSSQIRQIVSGRTKCGASLEYVLQGLHYADWELQEGKMVDRDGEPVSDPRSFVFTSLKRQGHYRRPAGYVSPKELAEKERLEEAVRLRKAVQERFDVEFDTWRLGLSKEQLVSILGEKNLTPSLQRGGLRNHFELEVWPTLKGRHGMEAHE